MTKLIDTLQDVPGVELNTWKDRVYVNLPQDGWRGDRTTKIYIKGDTLTVQDGKGYRSDKFNEAYRAMVDALEAAGAEYEGYSDTISGTWTLA